MPDVIGQSIAGTIKDYELKRISLSKAVEQIKELISLLNFIEKD